MGTSTKTSIRYDELSAATPSASSFSLGQLSKESQSPLRTQEVIRQEEGQVSHADFVHGFKLYMITGGLCLAVVLMGLDITLLASAVPTIANEFNSLRDIGWYSSVFFIAICCCQALVGRLFQLFDLKFVYICFIVVFEVGSLVCGLANSSAVLIAGRAIAGIGASGIFSGALIIISTVADPVKVPLFTGIITGTFGLASILGPLIGGALTQHTTWRWCFYINLPFGALACLMLALFFQRKSSPKSQQSVLARICSLDIVGFGIFSAATVLLLCALQWAGQVFPWSSALIIALLTVAGVLILAFIAWEYYKNESSSFPRGIICNPSTLLCCIIVLLANGGFQTTAYYLPIWFQVVRGFSPTQSGINYLPTVVADVVASFAGGFLIVKSGYCNPFLLLGLAALTVSAGLNTLLTPTTSSSFWIGTQVLAGVGNGLLVQTPFTIVQRDLPPEKASIAFSMIVYFQFLSSGILQSVAQNIFLSRFSVAISQKVSPTEAQFIISSSVADLRDSLSAATLPIVVDAYSNAITRIFYISLVGSGLALLTALGLKWSRQKNVVEK